MAQVVPAHSFLLRRTADNQARAARAMRDLVDAVRAVEERLTATCETASRSIAASVEQSRCRQAAAASHRRPVEVIETGDIAAMEAERDRLCAVMALGCNRCARYGADSPAPHCEDCPNA